MSEPLCPLFLLFPIGAGSRQRVGPQAPPPKTRPCASRDLTEGKGSGVSLVFTEPPQSPLGT